MPEVLSQSQIDALLSAVRSGEKDLDKSGDKPEKKYRKYDFNSPRKFTKDRIKMLNSVFENYTRVISARLNGLLRINCEVTVESIEEQKYFEFSMCHSLLFCKKKKNPEYQNEIMETHI